MGAGSRVSTVYSTSIAYLALAVLLASALAPAAVAVAGDEDKALNLYSWKLPELSLTSFSGESVFWSTGYRTVIGAGGEASWGEWLRVEELTIDIGYNGDDLDAYLQASGEITVEECSVENLEQNLSASLTLSQGVVEASVEAGASWSGVECKDNGELAGEGRLEKSFEITLETGDEGGFTGSFQATVSGSAQALLGPEHEGDVNIEFSGSIEYSPPEEAGGQGLLVVEGSAVVEAGDEEAADDVIEHIVDVLERLDEIEGVEVDVRIQDSAQPTIEFSIEARAGQRLAMAAAALASASDGEGSLTASLTVSNGEFTLEAEAGASGGLASLAGLLAGVNSLRIIAEVSQGAFTLEAEVEGYTDYPVMAFEAHRKLYLVAAASGPEEYSVVLSTQGDNALYIDGAVTDRLEVTGDNIDSLKRVVLLVGYTQQQSSTIQQAAETPGGGGGLLNENKLTALAGVAGLAVVALAGYILILRNRV